MFRVAKDSANKSRTQAINQLKAILVRAEPVLRDALSGLSLSKLIRRCTELETTAPTDPASAAVYTLRLLAARITSLSAEIEALTARITEAISAHTPTLLQQYGRRPRHRRRTPAGRRRQPRTHVQ